MQTNQMQILQESAPRPAGDKWVITYTLQYAGIPLSSNTVASAIVTPQENAVETVRFRNVPRLGVDGTEPTIDADRAVSIAKQRAAAALGLPNADRLQATPPTKIFETLGSAPNTAQLGWSTTVSIEDPIRPYKTHFIIKAIGEPSILREESLVLQEHKGSVKGSVWMVTPVTAASSQPLRAVSLTRVGAGGGTTVSDAVGGYKFNGDGQVTIKGELISPFFQIKNQSSTVQQLAASVAGNAMAPIDLTFSSGKEHEIAQVSAFFWAHRARESAGGFLQPTDLQNVKVLVNLDDTCNAYFQAPDTLGLFRGGKDKSSTDVCVNRAYADTIFHEYGHAIDFALGGYTDKAYSEGFGDALAILATRSKCYGRDSRTDASGELKCLRSAVNTNTWPGTDLEEHTKGTIYSGFVLRLVEELQKTMSEDKAYEKAKALVLGAAAQNPADIQRSVDLSLDIDDNDANRTNGTPNLAAIKAAAQAKKLWKPEWDPKT
jgi:hypothetical protein